MNEAIRITEVAPRDGLQNEPGVIATADKAELVRRLMSIGAAEVEVSSFVSPKWIPQLGDAAKVFAAIADEPRDGVMLSALVPNERGMQSLLKVNKDAGGDRPLIGKVSVFTAASETFSHRNTNATIAETIERFRPVIAKARAHNLATRGYVSCAVACPFEGPIAPSAVHDVCAQLLAIGIDEIDLGDTIGHGTPDTIAAAIEAAIDALDGRSETATGDPSLTLHLHDTFGRAASCIEAALDCGVRSFDSSAAGLGGCPFASTPTQRAPGNISTETLIATLEAAGFAPGIDRSKLASASAFAERIVQAARMQAAADEAAS
ncbi:MAG: hydroxymethylglutaryl-CoA lyase [Planctomycetota bacterium]